MKIFPLFFLLFLFVFIDVSAQSAQEPEILAKAELQQSSVEVKTPEKNLTQQSREAVPDFYRHHKKLPALYTGYAIELTTSELPLKRNTSLLKNFGNVFYEKHNSGGYTYIIKVNFPTKKKVKKFLNEVIIHHAPDAQVVEYKMGKRK